jgi:hypothetical protein
LRTLIAAAILLLAGCTGPADTLADAGIRVDPFLGRILARGGTVAVYRSPEELRRSSVAASVRGGS